ARPGDCGVCAGCARIRGSRHQPAPDGPRPLLLCGLSTLPGCQQRPDHTHVSLGRRPDLSLEKMIDWNLLRMLLVGTPLPRTVRYAPYEQLPAAGLTMGTLFLGRPGSGKTSALAR